MQKNDTAEQVSSILPLGQQDFRGIFSKIEYAVAIACQLHESYLPATLADSNSSRNELDELLDRLQATTVDMLPFTLGENSLVWVYSTAALRSRRADHKSFFALRLAELQKRSGFSGYDAIHMEVNWP
jgi:hypothetical protein